MRDILFIGLILLISFVALFRPAFGMLAFVCVSLLNPDSFTWGARRGFPFAQYIALGTLVGFVFSAEPKKIPRQREFFLLLALWACFAITTAFAIKPFRAQLGLSLVSKILLMVVLSTIIINNRRRLDALVRVIALSLGFFGMKAGFFSIVTGGNFRVWGPEGSFLEANNSIGLALAMNVPVLFYAAKLESDKRLKLLMMAMWALSFPAVVCTFSRGAWLGLAAASLFMMTQSRHKLLAIGVAFLMAISVGGAIMSGRVERRFDDLRNYEQEGSAQSRFWNWELCGRVGIANPLHGGGFDYYSLDAYATYFPEFLERWPGKVWSCHSMWLTVFGEHGFPGFLLWLLLLGSCLLSLFKLRGLARQSEESLWIRCYTNMLLGALLAYMVSGTFLDVAYFDLFYQLIAVVIILKGLVKVEAAERFTETRATEVSLQAS